MSYAGSGLIGDLLDIARLREQDEAWLARVAPDAAPQWIDGEGAARAAEAFAARYWSIFKTGVQAVAFAVIAGVLLCCFVVVDVIITSPGSDFGALAFFLAAALTIATWLVWVLVRTARISARLGAGAVALAAVARRHGRHATISGGWRRGVRVALAVVGILLSLFALLMAVSFGYADSYGAGTDFIAFLVLAGTSGAALSTVALVGGIRGLR